MTTGKILRKEPHAFNPQFIEQLGFDPKVYFEKEKPVAILTDSLNQNLIEQGNRLFRDRKYRKHILSRPNTLQRLLDHSPDTVDHFERSKTSLDSVDKLNLRNAIKHL